MIVMAAQLYRAEQDMGRRIGAAEAPVIDVRRGKITRLVWDRDRPGTVVMNVIWCVFNVVILGVTTAVAREMKQLRTTVRIALVTPVMAKLSDGRLVAGETIDMSSGGTSIRFSEALEATPHAEVRLVFPLPTGANELRATVVSSEGSVLRVKFDNLNISEQEVLTMVLYSRADSWLGWGESRENDNVMRSLQRIFQISMHGLVTTFKSLFVAQKKTAKPAMRLVRMPLIRVCIRLGLGGLAAGGSWGDVPLADCGGSVVVAPPWEAGWSVMAVSPSPV